MTQISFPYLLLALCLSIFNAQYTGFLHLIDPNDPIAIEAMGYVLTELFPKIAPHYSILCAAEQVVNGVFVEIVAEISFNELNCCIQEFHIWKRAGPPGVFVMANQLLSNTCNNAQSANCKELFNIK